MREFAVGGAALGSLSAFYFYTYASIQLPIGMLTDRFGPRKLMSFAAACCAIGSILFAMSDSLLVASIGRAFIGATVAFAFVGTLAIAGYWFKAAQFAMLAGILQSVGMSGGIFGQAPLRALVESIGWRGTMAGLAALALLLAILIFFLVPARTAEQKNAGPKVSIFSGLKAVAKNQAKLDLCGYWIWNVGHDAGLWWFMGCALAEQYPRLLDNRSSCYYIINIFWLGDIFPVSGLVF